MAQSGYPPEFGRRVVGLLDGRRKASEVAAKVRTELSVTKRRIRELETEPAIHRRAAEVLKEPSRPRGGTGRYEESLRRASGRRRLPRPGRLGVRLLRVARPFSVASLAP